MRPHFVHIRLCSPSSVSVAGFAGAGVGLAILFRMNKRGKENLVIAALLVVIGTVFGLIADLIGISLV